MYFFVPLVSSWCYWKQLLEDSTKLHVDIWVQQNSNLQNAKNHFRNQTLLLKQIKFNADRLGIRYSLPLQPFDSVGSGRTLSTTHLPPFDRGGGGSTIHSRNHSRATSPRFRGTPATPHFSYHASQSSLTSQISQQYAPRHVEGSCQSTSPRGAQQPSHGGAYQRRPYPMRMQRRSTPPPLPASISPPVSVTSSTKRDIQHTL